MTDNFESVPVILIIPSITISCVMGLICRVELENSTTVKSDHQICKGFDKAGWLPFVRKFHGHSWEVMIAFSKSFDGRRDVLGDLELQVDEELILDAIGLSTVGEKWVKHTPLKDVPWRQFLLEPMDPGEYMKGKW